MKYVALLRGIGPGNPNMRNEKLRQVFEKLGFTNVKSVISSGNIIFESRMRDVQKIESMLEATWPKELGFTSTTIIRNQRELKAIADLGPFKGLTHSPGSYLMVTFFKRQPRVTFDFPYHPAEKPYYLPSATNHEIFSVTDNTDIPTTDLMTWLEKQFGKEISSRTWLTVQRILAKMERQ